MRSGCRPLGAGFPQPPLRPLRSSLRLSTVARVLGASRNYSHEHRIPSGLRPLRRAHPSFRMHLARTHERGRALLLRGRSPIRHQSLTVRLAPRMPAGELAPPRRRLADERHSPNRCSCTSTAPLGVSVESRAEQHSRSAAAAGIYPSFARPYHAHSPVGRRRRVAALAFFVAATASRPGGSTQRFPFARSGQSRVGI